MVHKEMLVGDCPAAYVGQKAFVFLVFADDSGIGAQDTGPEGAEHFAFGAFLGIGFTNDCALEIQKLAIDGFEKRKESCGVGQFAVDRFFQDR